MKTYKIKPLVWVPCDDERFEGAGSIIGAYHVSKERWYWTWWFSGWSKSIEPSYEAAKAAAEAHYRERILTALEVVG